MHTKTITSSSGLQTIDRSNNRRTVVSGCIELKLQRRIDGVGHRCRPAGRGPPLSVSPSIIVVAASTLQCHRNDAQPSSHHRSTFLSLYSAYISPSLQLHTHRQTDMHAICMNSHFSQFSSSQNQHACPVSCQSVHEVYMLASTHMRYACM